MAENLNIVENGNLLFPKKFLKETIEKRLQIKTKYYQKVPRDKNWLIEVFR